MSDRAQQTYAAVCQQAHQIKLLSTMEQVLGWDERTQLPLDGAEYRAEQMTYLAGQIHDLRTDTRFGEWLDELSSSELAADPRSDTGTTVRQLKREYDRQSCLPKRLVEELSRTAVLGQHVWQEAREEKDYQRLAPLLEKTIGLKKEQAQALGFAEHPYDPLLDEFEPGATVQQTQAILEGLRDELVPFVRSILDTGHQPDTSFLRRHYPRAAQEKLGVEVARKFGFDFQRGRLDETAHPFCTTLGPHDCRITTRYLEDFFPSAFFSIQHEAGHGLYEQGLRTECFDLPPGEAVSMGIHESQSRMWENFVGRGAAFWDWCFPQAVEAFPEALSDVSCDAFFAAVNQARPSPIRVEADEATYNLHILLRFELEVALLAGEIPVADLRDAWNAKTEEYIGLTPENDSQGILQDIHWSAGLFGYFPTYSLGNLYAAQFFHTAEEAIGPLDEQFRHGEFQPLLTWLQKHIHQRGQCDTPAELVQDVTGQPLDHSYLMQHLKNKLEPLYGLR